MDELPRNTADRLRLAADMIELHPHNWDQEIWALSCDEGGFPMADGVSNVQGQGVEPPCGSAFCLAGWLVRLTPSEIPLPRDWEGAGEAAGGLDARLAEVLFHPLFASHYRDDGYETETDPGQAPQVAFLLRRLAELPEGGRTSEALALLGEYHPEIAALTELVSW